MIIKIKKLLKENKIFVITLIILILITLISTIFIFSNTNKKQNSNLVIGNSNYSKSLMEIGKEINKINLSLEFCVDDLTINTDKSKNTLYNNILLLKELEIKLSNLDSHSEEDQLIKDQLTSSIYDTLSLYDICLFIVSNPSDVSSGEKLSELILTKEKCIENYSALTQSNIPLYFSKDSLIFFDNLYNYINTTIKVNRETEIKNSKQREFIISLNSFFPTMDNVTENLTPAIEKVRDDGRNLQILLDDIKLKKENLMESEKYLYTLSVPDGCIDIFDDLKYLIELSNIYINSINDAILYEKSCTNTVKFKSKINKNYNNAESKREDVLNCYLDLKNLINNG